MQQNFSENDVIIKDTEKLYNVGFSDGAARARKIIENNPENLDLLNVIGLPAYLAGYRDGIESVKTKHQQENMEQPKQI